MKHSDFYIGLEFLGRAGFQWRCTDVGTRTILAIQLDREDLNWNQGPPMGYLRPSITRQLLQKPDWSHAGEQLHAVGSQLAIRRDMPV